MLWAVPTSPIRYANIFLVQAPLFKNAGLASPARATIDSLRDEQDQFGEEAQKHVPADVYARAVPCSDQIRQAFDDNDNALS